MSSLFQKHVHIQVFPELKLLCIFCKCHSRGPRLDNSMLATCRQDFHCSPSGRYTVGSCVTQREGFPGQGCCLFWPRGGRTTFPWRSEQQRLAFKGRLKTHLFRLLLSPTPPYLPGISNWPCRLFIIVIALVCTCFIVIASVCVIVIIYLVTNSTWNFTSLLSSLVQLSLVMLMYVALDKSIHQLPVMLLEGFIHHG